MRRLVAFVRLGRPQFLAGGFVLYGLGAALATHAGPALDLQRFLLGQIVVTATQLMTHYANDFFDLDADRANLTPTRWSGGSRVLPSGALPPAAAMIAARVLASIAVTAAVAIAFAAPAHTLALPIAGVMIALAWGYSAPPLRLSARGLGEVTTAVVVSIIVPCFGYYLQAARIDSAVLAATVLPAMLQFSMLIAIEFPDAAGDAAAGKRTLVVRLGAHAAAKLFVVTTTAGFVVLPVAAFIVLPALGFSVPPSAVVVAPLALAPIAVWQSLRIAQGAYRDPARWESVAFWSVALVFASGALELAAAIAGA